MSINRDVNLGTVIGVGLFLLGQTLAGVWWASNISATVNGLVNDLSTINSTNDRQWDRLSDQERSIQVVIGNDKATQSLINSVKDDMKLLRESIQENNKLIRDVLLNGKGAK